MASPKTIDLIVDALLDRIFEQYMGMIRAAILGEPFDMDALVLASSKAMLVADLEGRSFFVERAKRNGVEFEFDDSDEFPMVPDLPESQQYAQRGDGLNKPPSGAPAAALIKGKSLTRMARSFRLSVPRIGDRITSIAKAVGDRTRQIWANESVSVLETLAPILEKQLKEGVSLHDFFADAKRATQRAELGEIARARLENVFRTNLSTAAGEAAWEESHKETILPSIPFYQYLANDDNRVRPHHWAFDGFTAPTDWSHWRTIWTPNGYMCRCPPPISIFSGEAKRRGLLDKRGFPVEKRYKATWRRAITAGLLTVTGDLTYPRQVQMIDRAGGKLLDSFPQAGFA